MLSRLTSWFCRHMVLPGLCLVVCLCLVIGCVNKSKSKQGRQNQQDRWFKSDTSSGKSKRKQRGGKEVLPRLDELAQADKPKDRPLIDSGVVAAASLTRLWLPADQTINDLWREVSTASLSDAELLVWHRNQLRAALVSKEKLNAMLAKLPAHFGVQQQIMTLSGELIALDPANIKAAHRPVSLEIDGGTKIYADGKMQLLIAANPQSGKTLKVTIVPHQYVPRVTLLPRPHAESALDGKMFPKLMLRALISPGQVLLIAPDVPTRTFDDTRPEPTDSTDSVDPAGPADPADPKKSVDSGGAQASDGNGDGNTDGNTDDSDVNQTLELPVWSTAAEVKPLPYGLGQAVLSGYQVRQQLFQLLILEVQLVLPSEAAGK